MSNEFDLIRKLYGINRKHNMGQYLKKQSDSIMEDSWWNDPQSKICYIYDYYHDDQPDLAEGMTYENTTKTKIDAKFIITRYGSLSQDQVEFHIMFRPSQPVSFVEGDDLFYFETDYRKRYGTQHFPIGLYIDIPDDKGLYRKWLVCSMEYGNQFIKYSVLPINYHLQWIEFRGSQRFKRSMWCIVKSQNIYNSGLWKDFLYTSPENQDKIWMPLNPLSESIYYTYINGDKKNQRLIVSAKTEHPNVWKVSKVENVNPIGIQRLTLSQDSFNPDTDYVNLETGEMYADYYSSIIEPKEDSTIDLKCKISCNTNTIKVGGSYKTLTVNITDFTGLDVTNKYEFTSDMWSCSIDGIDYTSDKSIIWKEQDVNNTIKLKLDNNKELLSKTLTVNCKVADNLIGSIQLEISAI